MRPKVLILLGTYLPGFKSGGPVRTISSLVEALATEFEVFMVTLDRDSGEAKAYDSIRPGEWNLVGSARVFYVPRFRIGVLTRLATEVSPDVIYFNGFFATCSVVGLLARKLRKLPGVPAVLATRGDLASGALQLKSPKKRAYMTVARWLGLYEHLIWQASSEREKSEMLVELRQFGVGDEDVHVAPDLASGYERNLPPKPPKQKGEASFVTLSRIVKMKNPLFTLERIAELRGRVSLDIFGPIEDELLWKECEAKIAGMPENITVRYRGTVPPDRVIAELANHHFFILPTLGENYGHVIVEAAAAGCPVVISDRTQWIGLAQKRVGWDLPLSAPERWQSVLQECVDMDHETYVRASADAKSFGLSVMNNPAALEANLDLFRSALRRGRSAKPDTVVIGVDQ